jgi:nucleoid DNA-binding protein
MTTSKKIISVSEIIEIVAEKNPTVTKKTIKEIMDSTGAVVESMLVKGEKVKAFGWGVMSVKVSAARKGKNPKTLEVIDIPAKNRVAFAVSKNLKEAVNETAAKVAPKPATKAVAKPAAKAAAKPAAKAAAKPVTKKK